MRCGTPLGKAEDSDASGPDRYLDIHLGRKRRWLGTSVYILFFVSLAALLFYLFIQFTGSKIWAALLVGFMVTYMTLMGYWAGRNSEGQER
jgi:hypothetical protein